MVRTFPICCARSVYRDEKFRCSVFTLAMSRLVVIHRREEWQRDADAFPRFLLFRFFFPSFSFSFFPLPHCFPSGNWMVHRRSLVIAQRWDHPRCSARFVVAIRGRLSLGAAATRPSPPRPPPPSLPPRRLRRLGLHHDRRDTTEDSVSMCRAC